MKPRQHPKLAHLSEDEMELLIASYYSGSKASDLVAQFHIDARASELFKFFSPKVLQDILCPYCGVNLWQIRGSKSSSYEILPHCPLCEHQNTQGTRQVCGCKNCRQKAVEIKHSIEERKRGLVRAYYKSAELWEEPDAYGLLGRLSLRDVVFVAALFRNANLDTQGTVGPPFAGERPLAPTSDLQHKLITHLSGRGLIRVSADLSPLDAFKFDDAVTAVDAHYIYKVRYRLFPMLPLNMIADVMRRIEVLASEKYWLRSSETSAGDAVLLWKELALHEVLQVFDHQGSIHGLQPPSGEKTILTFQVLLEDYSVAQIYNFVWGAARDAAAYYQRGGITKSQAANSMVGGCRTRADKAKVEGWAVKPYGRDRQLPRSELNLVLHDTFTGIGEKGFTERPRADLL